MLYWLTGWLSCSLSGYNYCQIWLYWCVTDWLTDCLTWWTNWLTDCLTWWTNWLTDWLTWWLTDSHDWRDGWPVVDWFNDLLNCLLIDWLSARLCSSRAQWPLAPINFCSGATTKSSFFQTVIYAGHPRYNRFRELGSLWTVFLRAQPWTDFRFYWLAGCLADWVAHYCLTYWLPDWLTGWLTDFWWLTDKMADLLMTDSMIYCIV